MQKNEENLSERETQLHQSIERLQAEQAAAHAAIASLDAEIASSKAALQAAQRRFDVLGDDGAAAEIESHRLTIAAAEVVENLRPIGLIPSTESQARPRATIVEV